MKCDKVQYRFADLLDGRLLEPELGMVTAHLKECSACADSLAEMKAFLTAARTDEPWSPPQAYWDNLLPRIHQRIEDRRPKSAGGVLQIQRWFRPVLVLSAAATLVLCMTTFFPRDVNQQEKDVAILVNSLPKEEVNQLADRQQFESTFDDYDAQSTSADSFSSDDREALQQLLADEVPAMTLPSSDPVQMAEYGSPADSVFEVIQPAVEQSLASNY